MMNDDLKQFNQLISQNELKNSMKFPRFVPRTHAHEHALRGQKMDFHAKVSFFEGKNESTAREKEKEKRETKLLCIKMDDNRS